GAARVALAGLRVADAAGRPYTLDATTLGRPFVAGPGRVAVRVAADLTPGDGPGYGPPAAVEFWGTYSKAVEVPFALAGVPLTGGSK
ncbi:MAG: hypothetical protein K2X82_08175, partial [Gemmataceae bacterium]|nr:hypothetical protein [Gemmataceae bacterium]